MRELPLILLVDDDQDTREMYAWYLESRGLRVEQAGAAARGFDVAIASRPDFIVTDFTLPGADGFSLAARVRESRTIGDTPMILLTGRSLVGAASDRAAQLFERVLQKPVLPDQLVGEIVPLLLERTTMMLQTRLRTARVAVQTAAKGRRERDLPRVLEIVEGVVDAADAPIAALLADTSARYIGVNDAACVLTGRARAELLSMSVWDLTPGGSLPEARRQWEAFVEAGSLEGAYALTTGQGGFVTTRFAAAAHVLPDCHLALLQPVPESLLPGMP
jgi:CheY-like chemotaxis protein